MRECKGGGAAESGTSCHHAAQHTVMMHTSNHRSGCSMSSSEGSIPV